MLIRLIFEISSPMDDFETLLLLFFFSFEIPFQRYVKKVDFCAPFHWFLFTGQLPYVIRVYIWNLTDPRPKQKKLWDIIFFSSEAAGGLNQPPRSFSFSKESEKISEKLNSSKLKTLIPWNGHLKGFLDPLNCLRGRP